MVKYMSEMFTRSYVKNLNLKFDGDLVGFVTDDDLFEELELEDYNDLDCYSLHNEASDYIHEIADGRVDIYYYKMRQWAVDNWHHVEDAMEEGLAEGITDYHKLIQIGQFHAMYDELSRDLDNLINEIKDDAKEYYEQQQIELEL